MSFPDVTRILAEFVMERNICEAGVILEEFASTPFLLLIPRPGDQDSNSVFRTDVIGCEIYADSDITTGVSARDIAMSVYRQIEDAINEGPIWSPRGLIDSAEIHESESDDNLSIERDKYVLRFSIIVDSRSD